MEIAVSDKKVALDLIERMPDDASLEDIMYELYVLEGIQKGLADVAAGRTIPHAEVKQRVSDWLKSIGQ